MNRKERFAEEPITQINITPFVDIVLVLLVIFMITSQFLLNQGINLNLPRAASVEELKTNKENMKTFAVAIDKSGMIYLNRTVVSLEDLKRRAEESKKAFAQVQVVISADGGVPYQSVVEVMDVFRMAKIDNFALQMEETK